MRNYLAGRRPNIPMNARIEFIDPEDGQLYQGVARGTRVELGKPQVYCRVDCRVEGGTCVPVRKGPAGYVTKRVPLDLVEVVSLERAASVRQAAGDVVQDSKDATLRWLITHLNSAIEEVDTITNALADLSTGEVPAPDAKNLTAVLQERLGQLETTIDWALGKIDMLHPAAPARR
jgi:hypothetical protein